MPSYVIIHRSYTPLKMVRFFGPPCRSKTRSMTLPAHFLTNSFLFTQFRIAPVAIENSAEAITPCMTSNVVSYLSDLITTFHSLSLRWRRAIGHSEVTVRRSLLRNNDDQRGMPQLDMTAILFSVNNRPK